MKNPDKHLTLAQESYRKLSYAKDPDKALAEIATNLDKAGVSWTALDPTGKISAEEITQNVERKKNQAFVNRARTLYQKLDDSQTPKDDFDRICKDLWRAGKAPLSSLDKRLDDEAVEEELFKRAHIASARLVFKELPFSSSPVESVALILDLLDEAKAGYAVLFPDAAKITESEAESKLLQSVDKVCSYLDYCKAVPPQRQKTALAKGASPFGRGRSQGSPSGVS